MEPVAVRRETPHRRRSFIAIIKGRYGNKLLIEWVFPGLLSVIISRSFGRWPLVTPGIHIWNPCILRHGCLPSILFLPNSHGATPFMIRRQTIVLVSTDLAFLPFCFSQPSAKGHGMIPRYRHRGMVSALFEFPIEQLVVLVLSRKFLTVLHPRFPDAEENGLPVARPARNRNRHELHPETVFEGVVPGRADKRGRGSDGRDCFWRRLCRGRDGIHRQEGFPVAEHFLCILEIAILRQPLFQGGERLLKGVIQRAADLLPLAGPDIPQVCEIFRCLLGQGRQGGGIRHARDRIGGIARELLLQGHDLRSLGSEGFHEVQIPGICGSIEAGFETFEVARCEVPHLGVPGAQVTVEPGLETGNGEQGRWLRFGRGVGLGDDGFFRR